MHVQHTGVCMCSVSAVRLLFFGMLVMRGAHPVLLITRSRLLHRCGAWKVRYVRLLCVCCASAAGWHGGYGWGHTQFSAPLNSRLKQQTTAQVGDWDKQMHASAVRLLFGICQQACWLWLGSLHNAPRTQEATAQEWIGKSRCMRLLCVCCCWHMQTMHVVGWAHPVLLITRSRLLHRWGIGKKRCMCLLCVCGCLAYPQHACCLWLGSLRTSPQVGDW
jgi:hypothetical protein